MTRRGVIGLLAGTATTVLAGRGLVRPVETLRYRLTVEVETPQGLRSGSSVIEVRGVKNPDWATPEGRGTRSSFVGEAAAVDLPGGRTLFALLKTDSGLSDASEYPWFAFRDRLAGSSDGLDSLRMMRAWKGEVAPITGTEELRADNQIKQVPVLPMLVMFRNIRDPKSVERVDPLSLEASFGPGVSLRRITVEIADDAGTEDIERRLPLKFWEQWAMINSRAVHSPVGAMGNPYFQSLAGRLSKSDFKSGILK